MIGSNSIRFETGVAAGSNQPATPEPGLPQDTATARKPPVVQDPAMAQAIEDTQAQLGTMMVQARRSLKSRASAIHPELQPMGFKILMLLAGAGSTQQSELGRQLQMDKALLSRTVKQLELLELAVRSVDPHDGRAMLVAMTERGQERYTAALLGARQQLVNKLSQWDLVEVRRLSDLLARLNESEH